MLYLNKLLPIFVLPLGWVVMFLLLGILRKKRWPLIAGLAVLYVSSMPVVGSRLTYWLESRHPMLPLDQVENADAIVPLSGFIGPRVADGILPNVGEAGERLEGGIVLWQKKKAAWLVFTGGRLPWSKAAEVEGAVSKRAAIARGIPAEQILVTREVGNTSDEAHAVHDLLRERGWRKIILITSGWHMPRAARLFRKAGVDFVPFPVDFQSGPQRSLMLFDFLPQAEGLQKTETAIRELYGIMFYAASQG